MGGNVAFELARRHPDLPAAVVAIDSAVVRNAGQYLDMNHRVSPASRPLSASTCGTSPTSMRVGGNRGGALGQRWREDV
jgi:pimeloyl-ACP methyl ester carboxylesterase